MSMYQYQNLPGIANFTRYFNAIMHAYSVTCQRELWVSLGLPPSPFGNSTIPLSDTCAPGENEDFFPPHHLGFNWPPERGRFGQFIQIPMLHTPKHDQVAPVS